MDAAAIKPTDHVLDVGCGTGQTTRDAARAAALGSALGIDLSSRTITLARQLAADERVANAVFVQGEAQDHAFDPASFDVVAGRTGAMFFGDPVAAFSNLAAALGPGGRLVLLAWQPLADNEWIREFSTALAGRRERPAPPPDAP